MTLSAKFPPNYKSKTGIGRVVFKIVMFLVMFADKFLAEAEGEGGRVKN